MTVITKIENFLQRENLRKDVVSIGNGETTVVLFEGSEELHLSLTSGTSRGVSIVVRTESQSNFATLDDTSDSDTYKKIFNIYCNQITKIRGLS